MTATRKSNARAYRFTAAERAILNELDRNGAVKPTLEGRIVSSAASLVASMHTEKTIPSRVLGATAETCDAFDILEAELREGGHLAPYIHGDGSINIWCKPTSYCCRPITLKKKATGAKKKKAPAAKNRRGG